MANNPAGDVAATPPGRRWIEAVRRTPLLRLLIFFAVLLAADIGAQLGRVWAIRHAPPGHLDGVSLGSALLLAAILLSVYVGLVRSLERRPTLELQPRILHVIAGMLLGLALFSSVFGLLHVIGVAQWRGVSAAGFDVIPMLAVAIIAAVGEELAFRGGLFRILEESFGTGTALALSAALFGLLHALNSGATVVSTVAIALEAGVLLAAAYSLTRNLWLPIGLHFGWNFTEGGIFGASVSGGRTHGIFSVSLSGPTLLTGGRFGPEASVVAIAVCFAVAIVLLVFAVRNGRWIPMRRLTSRQ